MEEVLIPIAFFAVVFGIVYIVASARHKEKMALIESGGDPELFRSNFKFNQYSLFKWGLFLVFIALGIIVANSMEVKDVLDEEVAYPSMILLFGGVSLIISFLLRNKLDKKE